MPINLDIAPFSGGDGGIRTHVPISGQNDFESFSLRPLRYVSIFNFQAPSCKIFRKMQDFDARYAEKISIHTPDSAPCEAKPCGRISQKASNFRVLHHRPLGQLSIFNFSSTVLRVLRTNARFRCKICGKNFDTHPGFGPV